MHSALFFAVTQLHISPTLNGLIEAFDIFLIVGVLVIIGMLAWRYTPIIRSKRTMKKTAALKVSNAIWLDSFASEIHLGDKKKRVEPTSFEYHICEIVFSAPSEYHNDIDIFDKVDEVKGTSQAGGRGVEHGVRRVNEKFKELGLKDDLFKRSKERTTVNSQYQQYIVIN